MRMTRVGTLIQEGEWNGDKDARSFAFRSHSGAASSVRGKRVAQVPRALLGRPLRSEDVPRERPPAGHHREACLLQESRRPHSLPAHAALPAALAELIAAATGAVESD